jgi:site-specific DNA-methyltransferase (adenine-specific)
VGTTVEQLKAYTIKDNSGFGEWDFDMLSSDWDLSLLSDCAIDLPEIELPEEEKEIVEDDFSEEEAAQAESRVQRGDIWRLGEHRLMCGDSTDAECVKALMGGQMADLYLTDPPYNVDYVGKTKDALKIQNDSMDDDKFRAFLTDAFMAANDHIKKGAAFYIWHADSEGFNFRYAVKANGWLLKQTLIWVKNSLVMGRQDYQWKHEPCLYGWKEGKSHYFIKDRKQTTIIDNSIDLNVATFDDLKNWYLDLMEQCSVIYEDKPNKSELHPTMKPVKLIAKQITNSSRKNENVLDLFAGSGTTLIACEQTDRNAYVMEYDEKYATAIIDRWEKLTGQKAEKIC